MVMVVTLFLSMGLPLKIEAVSTAISLGEDSLVDWVLDKERNTIVAITSSGKLNFISLDSFEITTTVELEANPSDIVIDGDSLYVSNSDTYKILKIDLTTNSIVEEITTSIKPTSIAVGDHHIFYSHSIYLYRYDFVTKQSSKVNEVDNLGIYDAELYLDRLSNILYLGGSGTTGSNLYAISAENYSLIDETTYSGGFPTPERYLVVDGNDIFYAGHKINRSNFEEIHGVYVDSYSSEYNDVFASDIVAVDSKYVYTTENIFDRNTYKVVSTYPSDITHMLLNDGKRYSYESYTHTIVVNNDPLPAQENVTSYVNNKLSLEHSVDKWIMDESNNRIYAISESSNELLYIDPSSMEIVARKFIGSIPSDMEIVNNKIYIALYGSTKIAIADIDSNQGISYLVTKHNPFEIEVDGNDLYYTPFESPQELFHVDLQAKTERVLELSNDFAFDYYRGSIVLDNENDILYLGEGGSPREVYAISTVDGSQLKTSGSLFSYPSRNILLDGEHVYYAGSRLNRSDISLESGRYFESHLEDLVSVTKDYVTSSKSIYNKETYEPIYTFPEDIKVNLFEINSKGNVFVSVLDDSNDKYAIYKFASIDELKSRFVQNFTLINESTNSYKLSWDTVTGDGYNVYAKKSYSDYYTKLNTTVLTDSDYTLTDKQLKSYYGDTVTFAVTSVFGKNESTKNTIEKTLEIPVPTNIKWNYQEVPAEWKPMHGETYFRVSWDLNNLMDGYNLYYYTSDNPTYKRKVSITQMPDNEVLFYGGFQDGWAGKTVYFEVASVVNRKESKLATLSHYFKVDSTDEIIQDPAPTNQQPNVEEEETDSPDSNQNQTQTTNTNTNSNGKTTSSNTNATTKVIVSDNNKVETNTISSTTETNKIFTPSSLIETIYTITIEQFLQIGEGETIQINLIENVQKIVNLTFTEELIKMLVEKNGLLSVEKETTSALIPSSIFAGNEQDTTVSIEKLEPVDGALSDVYDFTITQGENKISQFDEPVTLEFQVDPEKVTNPEDVKVYYFNEELQQWELIGGTYEEGVVTAQTNHFSIYSVFEKPPVEVKEHAAEDTKIDSKTVENNTKTSGNKTTSQPSFWSGMIALALIIGFIVFYIRRKKLV